MKVLFVARGGNHPATRLRVVQYLGYLKEAGIEAEIVDFPSGFLEWWRLVRRPETPDIVFFQKKRALSFWLRRFKARGANLIYDFDDAVMFNSPRHLRPESSVRMRHFRSMVKTCDGVIAGNSYLKSFAEPHNKNIWVMPTPMDTGKYHIKSHRPGNSGIILGWIGGAKTVGFLKAIQPALDRIAEIHPEASLKIVGNTFIDGNKMPIIRKEWAEVDEAQDVLSFDIGLSPLPDDPWSRGKCAAKLLQYMASGVPAVVSAVGVHNEIIRDGANGFLARNNEEWFGRIKQMIEDIGLRQKLGAAARETAERHYSIRANAPKLVEILKTVNNIH